MYTSETSGPHADPSDGAGQKGVAPAAEILTLGDELCRGEILDTNSMWLAERLTGLGLHVRWKSSTTDDEGDLEEAVRRAASRARVVIASGGLGPTDDDRTVDGVSRVLGGEPIVDEPHLRKMRERFEARGFLMTPNNLRQVRVPSGAEALTNRAGLAPGFLVEHQGASLFFTPGVPREMKSIFEHEIAPRLIALLAASGRAMPATAKRVWRVAGMGESHVDHRLRGLLEGPPRIEGATLHFRIAFPENLVTVVARRSTQDEADAVIDGLDGEVRRRLGGAVYGIDEETLSEVIGRKLRARSETLATAESCTGGLVGDLITDVPGSSDYFRGGVIAYSNDLKRSLLGVRAETLASEGAVSEACVQEMAEGIRRATGATWGIAVSGIAGPGGGSLSSVEQPSRALNFAGLPKAEKPVGLVHFAVAGPLGIEARRLLWPPSGDDGRRLVKRMATFAALNLLDKLLSPERKDAPDALGASSR